MSLRAHGGRMTWDQLLTLLGQKSITEAEWLTLLPHVPDTVEVDWVPGELLIARWRDEEESMVTDAKHRVKIAERVFSVWAGLAGQDWREPSTNDLRQITDRLKEGWSEQDLVMVAGAAWNSKWHVEHGQTTVHAIYRNADRVTEHLSRARVRSRSAEELAKAKHATTKRRK